MDENPPYFLGCPMWANRDWLGTLFARQTKPRDFLSAYARVLNAVEGNTTFYALPKHETVAHWRDATPDHFRFCFKLPRAITHEKYLVETEADVDRFIGAIAPLRAKMGPIFIQLPPSFDDLGALERFLAGLPHQFSYAVEVRHPAFFAADGFEADFEAMLRSYRADRVFFDTVELQALETRDGAVRKAQTKKPKAPLRNRATGQHPFVRYAGLPNHEDSLPRVAEWAARVAAWIGEGRQPYVFMHQVPDDEYAPHLCRAFHQALMTHVPSLPPLPEWPDPYEIVIEEGPDGQLSLF